jgi:hypothetical protein
LLHLHSQPREYSITYLSKVYFNLIQLQAAGNAVKRATDNLVKAAQQAIAQEEERSLVVNRR